MRNLSKLICTLAYLGTLTACPAGDGDGDEDTTGETGDGTESSSSSSGDGDGDGDSGDGDGDSGDGDGDSGDGDGDSGDGDGDSGDGDGDSGDGDGDNSCAGACQVEADCGQDLSFEECMDHCTAVINDVSAECLAVYDDFLVCLGGLTCEEYEDYMNEPTPDYPCHQEEAALDVCDGEEPPDPTGGDPDPTGGDTPSPSP